MLEGAYYQELTVYSGQLAESNVVSDNSATPTYTYFVDDGELSHKKGLHEWQDDIEAIEITKVTCMHVV